MVTAAAPDCATGDTAHVTPWRATTVEGGGDVGLHFRMQQECKTMQKDEGGGLEDLAAAEVVHEISALVDEQEQKEEEELQEQRMKKEGEVEG